MNMLVRRLVDLRVASLMLVTALWLCGCGQSDEEPGASSAHTTVHALNASAWGELDTVLASDGAVGDSFGSSVAVSGDVMVVGAYRSDAAGNDSGAAYVFERGPAGTDQWNEVKKLVPGDLAAGDRFGWSVAISGGVVVVGAHQHDSNGPASGAAYVFDRDQGGADNWGEVKKLVAGDVAESDLFGRSVAADGDMIVVGSVDADSSVVDSGAAYVFERDQGGADNWGELEKLLASDPGQDDGFGWSVAVSGDVAAVGAGNADANGLDSGAAYVFERDQGGADNWGEVKKIVGSDTTGGDHLGLSVSLDGNVLVAGAQRDYTNGTRTGSAHVFERDEGGADNWGEIKKLVASDYSTNARFGIGVSVSGDVVVVGADRDSESATEAGAAYVFERDEGGANNWGEVRKFIPASAVADDNIGWSVAARPDMVAVGAMAGDGVVTDSGAVFVFGEASTPPGGDAGPDGGLDAGEDTGPDGGLDAADDTGADAADGADVVEDAAVDATDTADTADAEDATTQDSGVDVTEDSGSDAVDDTGPSSEEDAGVADSAGTDDGCGCSSAAGPSNALSVLWVLLGLAGLRVRRRSRR